MCVVCSKLMFFTQTQCNIHIAAVIGAFSGTIVLLITY